MRRERTLGKRARERAVDRALDNEAPAGLDSDPVFAIAQVAVLVKIILTIVLLDPRSLDTFTLPKSVAAHSLSILIAALLLWLFARHGRAVLFWSPIHVGVGALLLAFAIATPFASDQTVAAFGVFKRYLGLTQMLDNALLYYAVVVLFREPRSVRRLAIVVAGACVTVIAYALAQWRGLDPLQFTEGTQNPISTMGNPNILGGFISVIGISAVGIVVLEGRIPKWSRVLLLILGAACIFVLYLTHTRAGLIAVGAGWLATLLLAARMRKFGRVRRVAIAAVGVAAVLATLLSPTAGRLSPTFLRQDPDVVSRLEVWRIALEAASARPVAGLGPDNFATVYPALRSRSTTAVDAQQNSTHDLWLYVLTSAGILGLAALLLLVLLLYRHGIRLAGRGNPIGLALIPLTAYLGQALVNVDEIVIDLIFWTCAGLIGAAVASNAVSPRRRAASRNATAVGIAGLAATALFVAFAQFPRIATGESMLAAQAFSDAGRGGEAVPFATTAVQADERRGETWSMYGTVLYQAGAKPAAIDAFATAAKLQPWQSLHWVNLGIVWREMGNTNAALAAAERAIAADPFNGTARQLLSQVAYERGDFPMAAQQGDRALEYELRPGPDAYLTTVSAYVKMKELDRAEVLSRKAVDLFGTTALRLQLASILVERGDKGQAMLIVDQILEAHPNDPGALALKQALTHD